MRDVVAQLFAPKTKVQTGNKDATNASSILKIIRENYSWAYPAVKDFAKAVWPAILTALGI